jgi:hypothetical protein
MKKKGKRIIKNFSLVLTFLFNVKLELENLKRFITKLIIFFSGLKI